MESIEYNYCNNLLHLVYIDNKEISLFLHYHIYQLTFLFNSKSILFNSLIVYFSFFVCSSFSNLAKHLSSSFPSIFSSLQLVQFSIIFNFSSNSFDELVIIMLKLFSW